MADYFVGECVDSYWDGYDDEPDGYIPTKFNTCRYCGKTNLHWYKTAEGWRLFDKQNNLHSCKFNIRLRQTKEFEP